jgi:lipoprotein-anchoring transpeptidase ErfK/SrfK
MRTTAPTRSEATTTTLPAYVSITAQATVSHLGVFNHPGARTPVRVLDNPWFVDPSQPSTAVPQVFLVESHRTDGWIRVLLPIRPNGSTGWVHAADVTLSPVAYRLRVQLSAHRITVFDRGAAVYTGPVADGAPSTPTPTGHYYLRVLIKAPDPNTVYGPYAYGLSSHSDVLTSFNGGDGETGIHGNDDASVLGTSVTHGCIRIDNTEITRLASTLPLGTPVDIEP